MYAWSITMAVVQLFAPSCWQWLHFGSLLVIANGNACNSPSIPPLEPLFPLIRLKKKNNEYLHNGIAIMLLWGLDVTLLLWDISCTTVVHTSRINGTKWDVHVDPAAAGVFQGQHSMTLFYTHTSNCTRHVLMIKSNPKGIYITRCKWHLACVR